MMTGMYFLSHHEGHDIHKTMVIQLTPPHTSTTYSNYRYYINKQNMSTVADIGTGKLRQKAKLPFSQDSASTSRKQGCCQCF